VTSGPGRALHVRGVMLPAGEERDLYVAAGRLTFERVGGAETVASRCFVLPGLVDAHCHVGIAPGAVPAGLPLATEQARTDRDGGALLLRDCGVPVDTTSLLDRADLPRIVRAGRHIARPKRYLRGLGVEVEPDELTAAVEAQARYGGGWVKLVGDWIDRETGDLAPLWPADAVRAAVRRAHELGARVAVHVFGEDGLPDLIAAGVDSVEHGTGLTDDLVGALAGSGAALVPTLINVDNFPAIADSAVRYPAYADRMRRLHRTARQRLLAAYEAGVPVFAGSDAGGGIDHGRVADEIRALHAAGLPAEVALAAGSWAARDWLGLPGLVEGAPADLVVYDADPRTDLSTLASPARIVLRGHLVR
jgi:imidazolonepropionase-like amidohydrolase